MKTLGYNMYKMPSAVIGTSYGDLLAKSSLTLYLSLEIFTQCNNNNCVIVCNYNVIIFIAVQLSDKYCTQQTTD